MSLFRRRSRSATATPAGSTPVESTPLARLRLAVGSVTARDECAFEELLAALPAAGSARGAGGGLAALRLLTERPVVVLRLDAYLRRASCCSTRPELSGTETDPVALVLAASHSDGRIREQAVRRMVAEPRPETMPFLVLRCADWARPVREVACAGLAVLLHERPPLATVATVRTALLIGERERGGFARGQVLASLLAEAGSALRDQLLAADDPAVRRFTLEAVVPRLRLRELTALAEGDRDRRVRSRAAEAAAREAVWTAQLDLLRRQAEARQPEVRIAAIAGLIRSGAAAEAVRFLDDPSALVRAQAREAARRTGTDALAHYRAAVAAAEPPLGAIDGLAEIGSRADGARLAELLAHPAPRVRRHALRALRGLGAVPVAGVLPLLRDVSAAVVREAAGALAPSAAELPTELLDDLLGDPRPAVRRAGYRLLSRRDRATALRAALVLAGDPHLRLAARGRVDATRLIGELAPRRGWARAAGSLDADPAAVAELLDLAAQRIGELGGELVQSLRETVSARDGA